MTDAETLIGSTGAERVRWAAIDFGPVNTALALVEVRGLPPTYDPEKARAKAHGGDRGQDPPDAPPWMTVLAAVKFDLATNTLFTYFDPDFQKEFEGLVPATATRAKFAAPFDARIPSPGTTIDLAITTAAPTGKKTKKAKPKEPRSAMYPRVDAIRGMDHSTSRGYYETCSLNLGKFFAHRRMQWFFARKWPVVFENQLDHLGHYDIQRTPGPTSDQGGGGGKYRTSRTNNNRQPYNWAEAMGTISVVAGIDAIYDRDDPAPQPRIMMYVASKYGLDELIDKIHPTYDALPLDAKRKILKSGSIEVLRTLPIRTSFWNWFETLRDKRGPKQDDVADAINMAIGAVERYYRERRLSPAEQDEHRDILNKAVRMNTSGAKTVGRAVPECVLSGKVPEIPPAPRPIVVPRHQSQLTFSAKLTTSSIIKTAEAAKKPRRTTPAKRAREQDTGHPAPVDVIVDDDEDDVELLAPVLKRAKPTPGTSPLVIPRGKGAITLTSDSGIVIRRTTNNIKSTRTAAGPKSGGVIRPSGSVTLYDIEDDLGIDDGDDGDTRGLGLEFDTPTRRYATVRKGPDTRPSASLYRPRDRSDYRPTDEEGIGGPRGASTIGTTYDTGDASMAILDAAVRDAY